MKAVEGTEHSCHLPETSLAPRANSWQYFQLYKNVPDLLPSCFTPRFVWPQPAATAAHQWRFVTPFIMFCFLLGRGNEMRARYKNEHMHRADRLLFQAHPASWSCQTPGLMGWVFLAHTCKGMPGHFMMKSLCCSHLAPAATAHGKDSESHRGASLQEMSLHRLCCLTWTNSKQGLAEGDNPKSHPSISWLLCSGLSPPQSCFQTCSRLTSPGTFCFLHHPPASLYPCPTGAFLTHTGPRAASAPPCISSHQETPRETHSVGAGQFPLISIS